MNNEESKNESKLEIHGGTFNSPIIFQPSVTRDQSKAEANQYNYTAEDKKSLAEAAAEIQELLDQLSEIYSNPEEAKQKTAEEIAKKAKDNPSFKESLKNLGKSLGNKAGETAVTDIYSKT
ncbi:MAG: hypothetical protein AAGJ08_16240 [Cyanobacteria bacterium P01_H01_bin.35]